MIRSQTKRNLSAKLRLLPPPQTIRTAPEMKTESKKYSNEWKGRRGGEVCTSIWTASHVFVAIYSYLLRQKNKKTSTRINDVLII